MGAVPTTGDATLGESGVRIAIIGSGRVGTAVARAAIETGNDVTLTGADPARARRVAAQIGATAAEHNAEAVEQADIAVLAVPFTAVDSVAQGDPGCRGGEDRHRRHQPGQGGRQILAGYQ